MDIEIHECHDDAFCPVWSGKFSLVARLTLVRGHRKYMVLLLRLLISARPSRWLRCRPPSFTPSTTLVFRPILAMMDHMGDRMSCLNVYVGSVLCASALVLAAAGDVRADQRVSNTGKPADQVVEHVRPVSLVSDEDRRHWAFQKPVAFRPPEVNAVDRVRTPIDRFLLAKLEQNGLTYSLDADRLTLVRRASMDLVGLPPSLDEVQRFLDDGRADAYEQLIDRLLASPHYGERWGRHWLDAAGYVDVRFVRR